MSNKFNEKYKNACQKVGAALAAPKASHVQIALFAAGTVLISSGLMQEAFAQIRAANGQVNTVRITQSTNAVLTYLEGSFGALVMVASGVGAILSAAFGQYRAALGLMVVAIGSFILRSLMSTFFNDTNIQN